MRVILILVVFTVLHGWVSKYLRYKKRGEGEDEERRRRGEREEKDRRRREEEKKEERR